MLPLLKAVKQHMRDAAANSPHVRVPHVRSWSALALTLGSLPNRQLTFMHMTVSAAASAVRRNSAPSNPHVVRLAAVRIVVLPGGSISVHLPRHPFPDATHITWEDAISQAFVAIIDAIAVDICSRSPASGLASQAHIDTTLASSRISRLGLHPFAHLPSGIIHWNVGTLCLNTPLTIKKLSQIRQWLDCKKLVAVNEHHWLSGEESTVMQQLQCLVISTSDTSVSTPTGTATKGGVAIIVDRSIEHAVIEHRILVPGYALAVVLHGQMSPCPAWQKPHIVICFYARPDIKLQIIKSLPDALREWFLVAPHLETLPRLLVGDVNIDAMASCSFSGHENDSANDMLEDVLGSVHLTERAIQPAASTWYRRLANGKLQSSTIDRCFTTHPASITINVEKSFPPTDHCPLRITLAPHGNQIGPPPNRNPKRPMKISRAIISSTGESIPPQSLNRETPWLQLLRSMMSKECQRHFVDQITPLPSNINDEATISEVYLQLHQRARLRPSADPWQVLRAMGITARRWWILFRFSRARPPPTEWQQLLAATGQLHKAAARTNALASQAPASVSARHTTYLATCAAQVAAAIARIADSELSEVEFPGISAAARASITLHHAIIPRADALIQWRRKWQHTCRTPDDAPHRVDKPVTEGALKPPPAPQRLAKRTFPKLVGALPPTDDITGLPFASPELTEAALRASRSDLWTNADGVEHERLHEWMQLYKEHFVGDDVLNVDIPSITDIIGIILKAGPSSPGIDGLPYEVWKIAPVQTARCLFAMFQMLRDDPMSVSILYDDSTDVVVFIPKAAGLTAASTQRPIAIPTTLLRLFSSCGMTSVAKPWAARLHQAATALPGKGDCAANVRGIQAFLDWFSVLPRYRQLDHVKHIRNVLPPSLSKLCEVLSPFLRPAGLMRTAAFVDQVKAYEVLGYSWLVACWKTWNLPSWVWQWLHAIVLNRTVRIKVGKFFGPLMRLVKGLGMGGPHAPLQWSVGFDPIVWALDVLVGTHITSVFADDTALVNQSQKQLLAGQLMMIATRRVAGLRVAYHHCVTFELMVPVCSDPTTCSRFQDFSRHAANAAAHIEFFQKVDISHIVQQQTHFVRVRLQCPTPVVALFLCRILIVEAAAAAALQTELLFLDALCSHDRVVPCTCNCKCDLIMSPLTASLRHEQALGASEMQDRFLHDLLSNADLPPPAYETITQGPARAYSSHAMSPAWAWLAAYTSHRSALTQITMDSGTTITDAAKIEGDFSIWGGATVVNFARYLGPTVSTPLTGSNAYAHATSKILRKMRTRANAMATTSFQGAAYTWNMYILSCIPHIWAAIYVTRAQLTPVRQVARQALRTARWTTIEQLYAVQSVCKIKGFPISHTALASSAFTAAVLKDAPLLQTFQFGQTTDLGVDPLNPLGLRVTDLQLANHILHQAVVQPPPIFQFEPDLFNSLTKIHQGLLLKARGEIALLNCGQPRIKPLRRLLTAILQFQQACVADGGLPQLLQRSRSRTFGPTDGAEWLALRQQGDQLTTNVAYDFVKTWLNGHHDARKQRFCDPNLRAAIGLAPPACSLCQSADYLQQQAPHCARYQPFGWMAGVIVCHACSIRMAKPPILSQPPLWARLRANAVCLAMSSSQLGDKVAKHLPIPSSFAQDHGDACAPFTASEHLLRCSRSHLAPTDLASTMDGCRLCLQGEHSTEHLLWWCPAFLSALSLVLGHMVEPAYQHPCFLQGDYKLLTVEIGALLRCALLWQARSRQTSVANMRAKGLTCSRNVALLLREWWLALDSQVRPSVMPPDIASIIHNERVQVRAATPTNDETAECLCPCLVQALVSAGGQPQAQRPTAAGPTFRQLNQPPSALFAGTNLRLHQIVGATCSCVSSLLWPFLGHAHKAIPYVSIASDALAPNSRILSQQCNSGGEMRLIITTREILAGEEIILSLHMSPWIRAPRLPYISIMYDGSCPFPKAVSPIAGAGIVTILHLPDDTHKVLCTLCLSLPGVANAQIAEAMGARTAFKVMVLYGRELCATHGAPGIYVRGDSRVVTMNYNGHATIQAQHMSIVLLPLKDWAAATVNFAGCQHVPRAYNSIADAAAGHAARMTPHMVASPYIPVMHIAQAQAIDCADLLIEPINKPTFVRDNMSLIRHKRLPTGPGASANALLLTYTMGVIAADHGGARHVWQRWVSSCSPDAYDAWRLATGALPMHSIPCASFTQYLIKCDMEPSQAASVMIFFKVMMNAATRVAIHSAQTRSGTGAPSLPQYLYILTRQDGPNGGISFACRPIGLPTTAGDLDEIAIAILHQHLPAATTTTILPAALILLGILTNNYDLITSVSALTQHAVRAASRCRPQRAHPLLKEFNSLLKPILRGANPHFIPMEWKDSSPLLEAAARASARSLSNCSAITGFLHNVDPVTFQAPTASGVPPFQLATALFAVLGIELLKSDKCIFLLGGYLTVQKVDQILDTLINAIKQLNASGCINGYEPLLLAATGALAACGELAHNCMSTAAKAQLSLWQDDTHSQRSARKMLEKHTQDLSSAIMAQCLPNAPIVPAFFSAKATKRKADPPPYFASTSEAVRSIRRRTL